MEVFSCGYRYRHPSTFKINRKNGSGNYLLLLFQSPAVVFLNETRFETKGCSFIVFRKDTPQLYGGFNEDYIDDWIHFDLSEEELNWFQKLGIPFDQIIDVISLDPLSEFIKKMALEISTSNAHLNEVSELYLKLLLLKIHSLLNHSDVQKKYTAFYPSLMQLREELFLNPQQDWTIPEIAKNYCISQSHLQHLYKLYFNTSIKKDLTHARLDFAKYLLCQTESSISDVAISCGYENDVHFMRLFKKNIGMTPSEFRKRFL